MPRIDEQILRKKIAEGAVNYMNLRTALASERNNLTIITMPTLGTFDAELAKIEADARQQLNAREADAAYNVPILERLLTEMGESTETYVCSMCGQHRPQRVCSMCYEPEEY